MKHILLLPIFIAGCAAAPQREQPSAPMAPLAMEGPTWRLSAIDGAAVEDETLMVFGAGKMTGQGPCNALQGAYDLEGAAFSIGAILTTRMACERLDEENRMLDGMLLADMAELRGETLEISSDGGPKLAFVVAGR